MAQVKGQGTESGSHTERIAIVAVAGILQI